MGILFLYTMENIELSKRYLYLSSCAKLVRRSIERDPCLQAGRNSIGHG